MTITISGDAPNFTTPTITSPAITSATLSGTTTATTITSPASTTLTLQTNNGTTRLSILSTGETLQNNAYSGSGATNTAFALNTNYKGARIRARGAENGNTNTSYTEYLAVYYVSGWVVARTARAAAGNGYGSINLGTSGNYVTVSFDVSSIGDWWATVEYFN